MLLATPRANRGKSGGWPGVPGSRGAPPCRLSCVYMNVLVCQVHACLHMSGDACVCRVHVCQVHACMSGACVCVRCVHVHVCQVHACTCVSGSCVCMCVTCTPCFCAWKTVGRELRTTSHGCMNVGSHEETVTGPNFGLAPAGSAMF